VRSRRWAGPLLGLVLVVGLTGVAWVALFSPLLSVRDVEVLGAGDSEIARLSAEKVRAAVDVPADTPLARVDVEKVADAVEQLAAVESASVDRDWPRTLAIEVVARQPVAATLQRGHWRAVDDNGVVFGAYPQLPTRLPTVSAEAAAPHERDAALAEAAAVVSALEPAIAAQLETVAVSSPDDVVLSLSSGEQVRWGSAEDSARKAEVLTVLLRVPAAVYDVSVPELPTTSELASSG
jgi:cell division protein FtsQ